MPAQSTATFFDPCAAGSTGSNARIMQDSSPDVPASSLVLVFFFFRMLSYYHVFFVLWTFMVFMIGGGVIFGSLDFVYERVVGTYIIVLFLK